MTTPAFLKDAKDLLSEQGFATSNVWYHGTSSALVDSINEQGLKRSGDKALKQAAKQTMATIGNSYTETIEPVFLTQSKELAYYWAQQTVRDRSVRIEGEEEPVVFAVTLPEDLNEKVKTDVGAASLLMVQEGENYMVYLASIYQENGVEAPAIDLMKADRMDYLNKLGMAYYDYDVEAACLELVTE
ncbi:hypothetical protein [Neptuniibacter sp.]|uniref:hypothetical protein n=1 Tax=Neptuniibacter sp. TaxID=1962643 RepID=UPI002628CBB2|nr:hypothetical protein [Neptuniibacter sp.]MCP4597631.1 hypothetical protein [Neptuniibacter sp.]